MNYLAQWIQRAEAKRAWAASHPEEAAAEAARLEAEDREIEAREQRRQREIRVLMCGRELQRMGVPKLIADEIQADEERELRGQARRWQTKALEQARRWLDSTKPALLFVGGVGSGKSAASAWVLLRARDSERGCFIGAPEMARLSRFEDGIEWERIIRVPWLVVDDLGTESKSLFFQERMFELVNLRLARRLRTVFSSNVSAEEFKSRYGARVESRLRPDVQVSNAGNVDLRAAQ